MPNDFLIDELYFLSNPQYKNEFGLRLSKEVLSSHVSVKARPKIHQPENIISNYLMIHFCRDNRQNISFFLCCFRVLHPGVNPFENKCSARLGKFFYLSHRLALSGFRKSFKLNFIPELSPVKFHYSPGIV